MIKKTKKEISKMAQIPMQYLFRGGK